MQPTQTANDSYLPHESYIENIYIYKIAYNYLSMKE